MHSLAGSDAHEHAPSYELNSAIKKPEKSIVLATGSLLLPRGDIPYLVMISPERRRKPS